MNIWLPYVVGRSGTDSFTTSLADVLRHRGHHAIAQAFPHTMQYFPDVLRVVRPPSGADVALVATWNGFAFARRGLPIVAMEQLCVHDDAYDDVKTPLQGFFHARVVKEFEQRTFNIASAVVAVSQYTRRAVMAAFPGVDPVVIPNGVDTEFWGPSGELTQRRPGECFRLLFVGNFTRRKGVDLLGPVMDHLGPGFRLSYTSGLRDVRAGQPINSTNLGALDRFAVREQYRSAHALLFPTRVEGLPLTVLEAMACGLPVVGSNRTSMPETVRHGVDGLLAPLDAAALADAVRELRDDSVRRAMGQSAANRVRQSFTARKMAEDYTTTFRSVLAT